MAPKRTRKEFEADLQSQQSLFVTYGTPLPPLDPDIRDDGSYVPVWKQEVVDEKGRKRLHGAFQGGFSAGYYNTAGSKDGWAPSTFVSSRSNRHKDDKDKTGQRPEDYMDEEDLADADEAQVIQTNQGFSGMGSTEDDAQRKGGLLDLFQDQADSMGVKLLRKMGWRDGQGVGPHVRRNARLNESRSHEGITTAEHLFAPTDSPMIRFNRKDDCKGVGYDGESRLIKSSPKGMQHGTHEGDKQTEYRGPNISLPPNPAKPRGGFGVGVLNYQGSDDDDESAMGPRVAYNRTIGGDKKSKNKTARPMTAAKAANPLLKTKPVYQGKRTLKFKSGSRRCHDGRLPLEGFVLADASTNSVTEQSESEFAPPLVPDDWKSAKAPSIESNATYQSTADVAKASKLDAKARAAILGEAQLPGKSIFDFMSSTARERIVSASGKTDLPLALNERPSGEAKAEKSETPQAEIPSIEKSVALAAMGRGAGGWMPYAEDERKRQRYRDFIEHHAGIRTDPSLRPSETTRELWLQELMEFAHAAEVFKPVSGVMASRFTSASSAPKGGTKDSEEDLLRPKAKENVRPSDPAEEAARMGLFGPMTRTVSQFFPTRLLCKRFNVPLPLHAEADSEAGSGDSKMPATAANPRTQQQATDLLSEATMVQMRDHAQRAKGDPSQQSQTGVVLKTPLATSGDSKMIEGPAEVDASRNDALEGRRAGEAVFKAVFGDDDSDSD